MHAHPGNLLNKPETELSRNWALIYLSEHIACQPDQIKKNDINSNCYLIGASIGIICSPCKIEKFRI